MSTANGFSCPMGLKQCCRALTDCTATGTCSNNLVCKGVPAAGSFFDGIARAICPVGSTKCCFQIGGSHQRSEHATNPPSCSTNFTSLPSVAGNCLNGFADCCVGNGSLGGECRTWPYQPECDFGLTCGPDPLWCPASGASCCHP